MKNCFSSLFCLNENERNVFIMNNLKGKIGLMAASMPIMSYTACSSILAKLSEAMPDAPQILISMLPSIACILIVICSILVGKLTHRFYKRHLMLISGLLYPLSGLFIFLFHQNIYLIALFTACLGIASGVYVTCIPALIHDCYDEKTGARLLGLQGGFICVGAMIFVWLGSQFARVHWERCYLVYLLISFILVIELFCLPKGSLEKKKEKNSKSGRIPSNILIYTVFIFISALFVGVFLSGISQLVTIRGLGSTVEAGYATTIYNLAGIFAGVVTGYVITRFQERVYPVGLTFGLLGGALCSFGHSLPVICLGGALFGICFSTVTPAANYHATAESSDYNRSICVAIVNSANSMGLFLSPILFGFILRSFPLEFSIPFRFRITVVGYIFLIIFSICMVRLIHRRAGGGKGNIRK